MNFMIDIIIFVILGYGGLIFNTGCLLFIRNTIQTSLYGERVSSKREVGLRGGGQKSQFLDVFDE